MCEYFNLCKYADAGTCEGNPDSCLNNDVLRNRQPLKSVETETKPEQSVKKRLFFAKPVSETNRIFLFFANFTMCLSLLFFLLLGYGWLVSILTSVFINIYLRFSWRLCDWFRVLVKLVNEKRGVAD